MTDLDYDARVDVIRKGLAELAHTHPIDTFPAHVVDQLDAAHAEAFVKLQQLSAIELVANPGRWRPPEESTDIARVIDTQAKVMAAMGDGDWKTCVHLRRRPAQTAHVVLPNRRIDCAKCLLTFRRPPADEADRCDLCAARGIDTFWPLRIAVAGWVVLGDTCRSCARGLHNPAAA